MTKHTPGPWETCTRTEVWALGSWCSKGRHRQSKGASMTNLGYNLIGHWVYHKHQARAKESGTYTAALQLRKQGVPLWLARLILLGN